MVNQAPLQQGSSDAASSPGAVPPPPSGTPVPLSSVESPIPAESPVSPLPSSSGDSTPVASAQLQPVQVSAAPPAVSPQYAAPAQPVQPAGGSQQAFSGNSPTKKPRKIWLWVVIAVAALAVVAGVTLVLINVLGPGAADTEHAAPERTGASSGSGISNETTAPETGLGSSSGAAPADTPEPQSGSGAAASGSSEPDFGTGTLVGSWTNIMVEGGFATAEFTEDGRFTLVDRDGAVTTGTYTVTSGTLEEGSLSCSINDSPLNIEGDFHLNGNILTWGNMMFQREN